MVVRPYVSYKTTEDTRVVIGGDGGRGHENPETLFFINVTCVPCTSGGGDPTGEPVDVSIGLTVPQMAEIVKHFFWDVITWPGNKVFKAFLGRLLRKRWQVMTYPTAKSPVFGDWYTRMKYTDLP